MFRFIAYAARFVQRPAAVHYAVKIAVTDVRFSFIPYQVKRLAVVVFPVVNWQREIKVVYLIYFQFFGDIIGVFKYAN